MQYAVILAAGMGSRMKSHTIKVLHPILGKPMVQWSVDTALEAGFHPVVVVGHQAEQVKASLAGYYQQVSFALQSEAKGTGHAVLCALPELPADVQKGEGTVLVFFGDTPLFTAATLQQLVSYHSEGGYDVTFLTAELSDAGSYGRLVRDTEGRALRIVEAANASPEELRIQEFNTGAAVFDLAWLHQNLTSFQPHPPKGEIYLTDALEIAAQTETAAAKVLADVNEANGVNTRVDLAEATRILQDRIVHQHMVNGVGFADPSSVTVEPSVVIHPDTWIERGVVLRGETVIESDVVIDAYSVVEDCDIQEGVHIAPFSHCHQAILAQSATVGPFARLREGSLVGEGAKVGNFVEMKKTHLGAGAKANHLTYLGDAKVGAKANIGAGTITCNYNGFTKSKTTIGAGAFIGSNSALVAPVIVGAGAIVGAGSVITKDVPADDIAIARGEQRNLSQAAVKFRSRYQ